jgi:hypothetical protein
MGILNSEKFAEIYIAAVVEASPTNGSLQLEDFYEQVFANVSKNTGLSKGDIKYLHPVFHQNLFLARGSPLELVLSPKKDESYLVKLRKGEIRILEEVDCALWEYGGWLEAKLEKLNQAQSQ